MIKLGIISGNELRAELSHKLQELSQVRLTGFVSGYNELTEKMLHFQAEALTDTTNAIYFDQTQPSFELIIQALRKRNSLFFNEIPKLDESQIKHLTKLAQEAEAIVQLAIPLVFFRENISLLMRSEKPFLANIRLSLLPEQKQENYLLHLLLFLVVLDNSEYRKTDLMTIPNENGISLLETRILFRSGSVARILFSDSLPPGKTTIEIFSKDSTISQVKTPEKVKLHEQQIELAAFDHFLNAINKNEALILNLNHLFQAQQILQSLKSKMNYQGNFFSKKNYAG